MSISDYSNPQRVLKNAHKYVSKDVELYLSHHKNKKYAVLNPHTNKLVHFGLKPYLDYTKTLDKDKRDNFLKRNHKWATADKYSPAYLSYWLLWN
jgi:hypothetical protein